MMVELRGAEEIFEFFEANRQPGIVTVILTSKCLNSLNYITQRQIQASLKYLQR